MVIDLVDDQISVPDDVAFKKALAAVIPHLRAFGRSLCGSRDLADDLTQDTLIKAWIARDRFTPGTSMRAWTFRILRNLFLSERRRARFSGDWDPELAERLLAVPAGQEARIHLSDVETAIQLLPTTQREALVLVGAGGFSYEEAAHVCGVAVGTMKSRVARARAALEQVLVNNAFTLGSSPPNACPPMLDVLHAAQGALEPESR